MHICRGEEGHIGIFLLFYRKTLPQNIAFFQICDQRIMALGILLQHVHHAVEDYAHFLHFVLIQKDILTFVVPTGSGLQAHQKICKFLLFDAIKKANIPRRNRLIQQDNSPPCFVLL